MIIIEIIITFSVIITLIFIIIRNILTKTTKMMIIIIFNFFNFYIINAYLEYVHTLNNHRIDIIQLFNHILQ